MCRSCDCPLGDVPSRSRTDRDMLFQPSAECKRVTQRNRAFENLTLESHVTVRALIQWHDNAPFVVRVKSSRSSKVANVMPAFGGVRVGHLISHQLARAAICTHEHAFGANRRVQAPSDTALWQAPTFVRRVWEQKVIPRLRNVKS